MSELMVGIRELKSHLSDYLKMVKKGDVIIITEHDHPIGRIIPLEETLEEKMARLIAAGKVAWNGKKPEIHEPVIDYEGDRLISDLIIEDRE